MNLNNSRYCDNIQSKLNKLVAGIKQDNGVNLNSINIYAEGFFQQFLNILRDWNLNNANAADQNAKGIDLLYPAGNIVVQVSSTVSHEKLQSSLDKSQDHPGAHFYFVAIADTLPNYRGKKDQNGIQQPPFDAKRLVFDWKTDILTPTTLYQEAAQCNNIQKQKRLSDLVDQYFERVEKVNNLRLLPLGSSKARSDYEYNAGVVPFLGREAELDKLLDFVCGEDSQLFRWWAITAPGAAGKTRLAFELQNRLLCEGGWNVAALSAEAYRKENGRLNLLDLSDCLPGKTLLIADYVQQHTEELAQLIENLSASKSQRRAPLRLLLLERDYKDENGDYIWLKQIARTSKIRCECFQKKPLELAPLHQEGIDTDSLLTLIQCFANRVYETAEDKTELTPLPAGGEQEIRLKLNQIDPVLVRPLFAMLLADAWVHDPQARSWKRNDVLWHIVDREWGFVENRLSPYHPARNRALPDACRTLWQVSTVLGASSGNVALADLKKLLPDEWVLLEACAEDHRAELRRRKMSLAAALLTEAGLLEDGLLDSGKVPSLRPDLLGELFVLHGLKAMSLPEATAFFTAVLSDWTSAEIFFKRCLADYPHLVGTDSGLQDWFLPAEMVLEERDKSALVRLMFGLCGSTAQFAHRHWLISRMEAYAQSPPDNEDLATHWINLACVHRAASNYTKAIECYERARAIQEQVLGHMHPDTAMTYDDLATVYWTMGADHMVLFYYSRALYVWEKLLGPEHIHTKEIREALEHLEATIENEYMAALGR